MSSVPFQFTRGGIHLPQLALWLDPRERCAGPERAFVSHAHSDHTGRHREVILSEPTARLMQARLGGQRLEHVLRFGEARRFDRPGAPFEITLLPAGHILGSAMSYLEWEDHSLLYTGDFKLRRSVSAEPCEPRHAEMLIMETTFGRPEYRFPPADAVIAEVIRFCHQALDEGATPVLLGYSLGKSQELLCRLAEAGLPLVLHEATAKLTAVYERLGRAMPPYETFSGTTPGHVFICPPGAAALAQLRAVRPARVAVLTGWAMDPRCRYRYGVDAAFPLSDHADFGELIELVERVAPKRVFTMHGFAAEFAQSLRRLGWDARAPGLDEQLELQMP